MPTPNANTFETGIASGTAITTTNSDDGSAGDAASFVSQGANGSSVKFDNAHVMHGSLACKIAQGPTTPDTPTISWDFASAVTVFYRRLYFYCAALPGGPVHILQGWTGSAYGGFLDLNANGSLAFIDSSFANRGTSPAGLIAAGEWNRIELKWDCAAGTNGVLTARVFAGDGVNQIGSDFVSSAANFGASISGFGHWMNAVQAGFAYWIDDVAGATSGWIGPSQTETAPSAWSFPGFQQAGGASPGGWMDDLQGYVDGSRFNTQTADYTLVLGDAGYVISMNKSTANTLTVPNNMSVAFPTGTVIPVRQQGAGQTTIAAGRGVVINSRGASLALAGQYAWATLVKVGPNVWDLFGDLA